MEHVIVCPVCGSDDVFVRKSMCMCGECGHRFPAGQSPVQPEDCLNSKTQSPMRLFVSYAHAQSAVVEEIVEGLTRRGHQVWFDRTGIHHGDDWRKQITDGLMDSNGVVSFLSREAVRRHGVCLDELGIAVGVKYGNIRTVLLNREGELQPLPAQLVHRQWLDMSDWEARRAESPEAYRAWLNRNLECIIRMVESDESREFEGDISRIREKLDISDTAVSRQSWYLRQTFVGRQWLTEEIVRWLDNPGGGHMCAVYGQPGVGKSAFAAQFVYHCPRVAASLFFEHGNSYYNSPGAIVRELVFQLACRMPGYRSMLIAALNDLPSAHALTPQELFERLLSYPLQHIIDGGHETVCVVVDGLDECSEEGLRTAASMLKSERFPPWLRVLVLTRPEAAVTASLAPDVEIDMSSRVDAGRSDIREYYAQRLSGLLEGREDAELILEALTERTQGVFLYAHIVSDMLLRGKLRLEDRSGYPSGLSASFDLWFSRYFPDREEYDRLYRLPLGILAAVKEPVPVGELETADGVYDRMARSYRLRERHAGERPERMLKRLERCALLLKLEEDDFGKQTAAFAHRFIADWLSDAASGEFSCDPADAGWMLQRAWRNRLESGETLTEYQSLHLLEAMERGQESDEAIRAAASDDRWGGAIRKYRVGFHENGKWNLSVRFAAEEVNRCMRAYGSGHPSTLTALNNLTVEYMAVGRNRDAMEISMQVYEARMKLYGEEHEDTLVSLNNLASNYFALGMYREALERNRRVYEIRKRIHGEAYESTLISLNNLANDYSALGMYREALEMNGRVCDARRKINGEEHPDTLLALGNLASNYSALGMYREALEMCGRVYEARRKALGEEHPDTLTALSNLSVQYAAMGRNREALEKDRQVYETRRRVLGEEHPDTLTALSNLAVQYSAMGRNREALEKERQVYEARRRTLGEEHPDTLISLSNLAAEYAAADRHREALEMKQRVYDARRRIFGEHHPDTLVSLNNLAYTCGTLGMHREALEMKQRVYDARREIFGEEHPDTLTALNNLAVEYSAAGRNREAVEMLERAYVTSNAVLGEEHPDTLSALNNLASGYSALDMDQKALEMKERAYAVYRRTHGEEHPDTLTALNNLAHSYVKLGRHREALEMFERAHASLGKIFGEDHADTLLALSNLAYTCEKLGRGQDALEKRRKVYEGRVRTLGEDHADTLSAMVSLATAYYNLGSYSEAMELEQRVYEARRESLGEDHADTLTALSNLAYTCEKLGRGQDALEMRRKVYEGRARTLGEDHADTLTALNKLSGAYYALGEYERCIALDEEAVHITEKLYGACGKEMATALNNLSMNYCKLERYAQALPLMERAYALRREILGEAHSLTEKARSRVLEFREKLNG